MMVFSRTLSRFVNLRVALPLFSVALFVGTIYIVENWDRLQFLKRTTQTDLNIIKIHFTTQNPSKNNSYTINRKAEKHVPVPVQKNETDKISHSLRVQSKGSTKATIVISSWTAKSLSAYSDRDPWFEQTGRHSIKNCYTTNILDRNLMPCEYTNDRKKLMRSDAVLFRARQLLGPSYLPDRTPSQKWIIYEFEPPYKTWIKANLTEYNGVFNLTSMYARDSDIPNMNWHKCSINYSKLRVYEYENFVRKKRVDVLAAWFVTICHSESKREDYVRKLQQYIKVDIYGQCGPLKCGTNQPKNWQKEGCLEKLLHNNNSYKFYLAFENSLCSDYVTEKLWKVMDLDVVPIVMGGAKYSSIMPPDTYIDVKDYPDPKDLANYIHKLNQDDEMYSDYLRKKKSLNCKMTPGLPLQCQICRRLHELKDQINVVEDLGTYWGHGKCMTKEQYFSTTVHR